VIGRHAKRLRHRAYRVTIDLDPTDDPTHGAQQLSFFNGYYDIKRIACALGSRFNSDSLLGGRVSPPEWKHRKFAAGFHALMSVCAC
jgi:hypothetical protein